MRIKINYQINEKDNMKRNDALLAKCELNQQNRKDERKIYERQIKELNKKLENLTQTKEWLKNPFHKWLRKQIKKL